MAVQQDRLLQNMTQLTSFDQEMTTCLKNIRRRLLDPKMTDDKCIIAGSVAEGCWLAKFFHEDPIYHEVEIDLVHIGATFYERDQGLIEPIPGKPDHLKLIWDRTLFSKRCEPVVRDDYLHLFYGRYMDPLQVRKAGFDLVEFKDDDDTTKTVVCVLYETPMCDIGIRTKETIKGTAATLLLTANDISGNHIIARGSVDNVPAFRFRNTWPEVASNFASRMSQNNPWRPPEWPTQKRRRDIMAGGCDVVPKSSPTWAGGNERVEWRWSFSTIETELMNDLSAAQKRAYFLAKIMFYKHIKPIDNEEIHSYWAKTTMLWICEDYPAWHSIWKDANIKASVKLFFVELRKMITRWRLPHFFITEHSLLQYTNKNALQQRILNKIDSILGNKEYNAMFGNIGSKSTFENHLPSDADFQHVFNLIEPQRKALNRASRFADETVGKVELSMHGLRWLGAKTDLLPLLAPLLEGRNLWELLGPILLGRVNLPSFLRF